MPEPCCSKPCLVYTLLFGAGSIVGGGEDFFGDSYDSDHNNKGNTAGNDRYSAEKSRDDDGDLEVSLEGFSYGQEKVESKHSHGPGKGRIGIDSSVGKSGQKVSDKDFESPTYWTGKKYSNEFNADDLIKEMLEN